MPWFEPRGRAQLPGEAMSGKTDKKVRKIARKKVAAGEIPLITRNKNEKDEQADIIVPIGDLSRANLDAIPFDENYEKMTEDFIDTFNHGVTQGMPPQTGLFAFGSAFAVVLGCAIRAGLPQAQVGKLLMMIGRNAAVSSKMVQILQNLSVGQAVANVIETGKKRMQ